jgi:hypothetical protein
MGNLHSKKKSCKNTFLKIHNGDYDYYSDEDRNKARLLARLREIYMLIGMQGFAAGMSLSFFRFHSHGRSAIPVILVGGWLGKDIMYYLKIDEILTAIQENLQQDTTDLEFKS